MKQQLLKASILIFATLLAACNNETKEEIKENPSVIVDAGKLKFNITEAPFGADAEINTRNIKPIAAQKVDLGEGIEAEMSLEHEAVPAATRAPKAMSDGNYTIVAYKDGVRVQQKITFTVNSGIMTITSTKNKFSWLTKGNYTFVCFNDKVQDNNNETFTVSLANAETALLDKQSITIDNSDQEVNFSMKHMGARVRTKLVAAMAPTGVVATLGYQAGQVSTSTTYNIATNTYNGNTIKNSDAKNQAQNYDITGTVHDTTFDDDFETVTGNQYLTVLGGTKPEELVYNITSGTVYNVNLNTKGARKLKATGVFEANGAYTLTIRLIPRYQYLFEDGIAGYLNAADRQGHTPIAIVFAPHKAIALWAANGGNATTWDIHGYYTNYANGQRNSMMFNNHHEDALNNTTSGKVWTWESWDSNHDGNPVVKANDSRYFAYYYAGNFYKSSELTSKATLTGTNINKSGVWYLPSINEWKEVFTRLGFGDGSQISLLGGVRWKSCLIDYAFTAAHGTSLISNGASWSSSESDKTGAYTFGGSHYFAYFHGSYKHYKHLVRPFVEF